ncbi:RraA-like protein [Ramicandelaber brevisporus]|nr:RraA-like protein [Ramicandelaber brevisporus]
MNSKLQDFDVNQVADALDALGLSSAYHLIDFQAFGLPTTPSSSSSWKLYGPAHTVRLVPFSDSTASKVPAGTNFMDTVTKDCVVVVSAPDGVENAVMGGLLAQRGLHLGFAGALVDGRIRDVAELDQLDVTILARGTSPLSARQRTKLVAIGEPIEVKSKAAGGVKVVVKPGDIVYGDRDGVVIVPVDKVEDVVKECEKIREIDGKVSADISNGISLQASFATHR